MKFHKLHGTGNDFIFFDESLKEFQNLWEKKFGSRSRPEVVKEICTRQFSIGADGVVFLKQIDKDNLEWDFYNSDGSSAEFCGNAARCAGWFGHNMLSMPARHFLKTLCGVLAIENLNQDEVSVEISKAEWISERIVNSGVPHFLCEVDQLEPVEQHLNLARQHRHPKELDARGANVTIVENSSKDVKAATYERGVEGFTLACGSGAIAAGIYRMKETGSNECGVTMPGGKLRIQAVQEKFRLIGPAAYVYGGLL